MHWQIQTGWNRDDGRQIQDQCMTPETIQLAQEPSLQDPRSHERSDQETRQGTAHDVSPDYGRGDDYYSDTKGGSGSIQRKPTQSQREHEQKEAAEQQKIKRRLEEPQDRRNRPGRQRRRRRRGGSAPDIPNGFSGSGAACF